MDLIERDRKALQSATIRTDEQGFEHIDHTVVVRSEWHNAFDDGPAAARVENRRFSYHRNGKKCMSV